jgi:hypothetical protein
MRPCPWRFHTLIFLPFCIPTYGREGREETFDAIVGYEEEGGSRGGPDDGGADAAVDSGETAGGEEAA